MSETQRVQDPDPYGGKPDDRMTPNVLNILSWMILFGGLLGLLALLDSARVTVMEDVGTSMFPVYQERQETNPVIVAAAWAVFAQSVITMVCLRALSSMTTDLAWIRASARAQLIHTLSSTQFDREDAS